MFRLCLFKRGPLIICRILFVVTIAALLPNTMLPIFVLEICLIVAVAEAPTDCRLTRSKNVWPVLHWHFFLNHTCLFVMFEKCTEYVNFEKKFGYSFLLPIRWCVFTRCFEFFVYETLTSLFLYLSPRRIF